MDAIKYEFGKMFLYRKGAVILLLFFAAKILLLCFSTAPLNQQAEEYKQAYSVYLSEITGKLTERTTEYMEQEASALSAAASTVQTSYEKYYDGQISEQQLNEAVCPLMEKLENQKGFDIAYQQYLYVRQNPENRYFLYTNGWDALLSNKSPDYLLVLVLFLLIAPVFCEDAKCQMDLLAATMKKGGNCLSKYKILLSAFVVLTLSVSSAGMEILFCTVKYGLLHGNFPLQSLSYFGTSTKVITLWQAFRVIFGLKTLGYLCLGTMVLFCTVFFRKYATSLFVCMSVTFLPVLGMDASIRYVLPGPAALITASGFLIGNQTSVSSVTDETMITFHEVSGHVLAVSVAVNVLLCITMLLAVLRRCSTKLKRRHKVLRQIPAFFISFVLVISLLPGCSASIPCTRTVFNMSDAKYYETEQYLIYIDYNENSEGILMAEDKKTGERTHLVRDVMQSSYQVMNCIYGQGNNVYYIKMTADKSETIMYEMYDELLVQKIDLTDFSEQTVFRVNLNEKNLLGSLFAADQETLSYFLKAQAFFVDQNYLYVISSTDVSRIHMLTGKKESLIETILLSDVAYDGENIYYLNAKSELVKYNVDSQTESMIPDVIAKRFYMSGDCVYFLNRKDQNAIFKVDMLSSHVSMLSDKKATWLLGDDTWLFFGNALTGEIFRIDTNGLEEIPVQCLENQVLAYYFSKSARLYLPSLNGGDMMVLDAESLQKINPISY